MPWIKNVPYEDATGLLKNEYDAALKRAGRIFNIVSLQSLRPRAMRASIRLYAELMHAPSGLTRTPAPWRRSLSSPPRRRGATTERKLTQRICVPHPTTPVSPAPSSRTIAPRPSTTPPAPCSTSLIP